MSWGMNMGSSIAIIKSIPVEQVNGYSRGYNIILMNNHGWCGEDKFDYVHLVIDKFSELDGEITPSYDGSTIFDLDDLESGKLDTYILNHKSASLSEYKAAAKTFRDMNIDATIHYKYFVFDYLFDYVGPVDACKVCGKNERYEPPMENNNKFGLEIPTINCEAKNIPHQWYKWDRAETLGIPRYAVCYDVVVNGVEYEVATYGSTKKMRLPKQFDDKEEAQKECDRLTRKWKEAFTRAIIQG